MLPHEEHHEFLRLDAQLAAGIHEILLRIIRHEVGSVVHHFHVPFEAILAYHVYDRFLGHPDHIRLFVEVDYHLDDCIHDGLGKHAGEIVPVFRMEGSHERDTLKLGYALRRHTACKGAVGVDYLEVDLGNLGQVPGVYLGHSGHVGMPLGHRYAHIVKHLVIQLAIIGPWYAGRDDLHVSCKFLEPFRVVLHAH